MLSGFLNVQRDLRDVEDTHFANEEFLVRKIMATYDYDRENAVKILEYIRVKRVETIFGAGIGALAVYKANPVLRELEVNNPLFRKAWMRVPLRLTAFVGAYYIGTQLPVRLFRKISRKSKGVTQETAFAEFDYTSRFRLFENNNADALSADDRMLDYLAAYSSDPLSEPELKQALAKRFSKDVDMGKLWQVKRIGKDEDDFFFHFGKIHGLENIAYISDKKLEECNNPVDL